MAGIAPLSAKENMLWNSAGSLVYQGCLWLITVFVVLLSSNYENSGVLAYAMAMGNIFSPIAVYSIRTFQISDIGNEYSQPNYIALRLITIALGLVVIFAYSVATTSSTDTLLVVILFIAFKADESFVSVCYGSEQKGSRMDFIGVSQCLRGVALMASFSIGLCFFDDLALSVACMTLACMIVTLAYDLPHARLFGSITPKISSSQCLKLLKVCFPAVLATIMCGAVVSISRQYYGIQYGNEALGIYAAVATPSVIIQLLAQYLYSPFLTPIARKWHSKSHREFILYFIRVILCMLLVILCAVLVFGFAGQPIIELIYGSSIADYTYLLPYVMVTTGLVASMWFVSDVLIIFRDFKGVLLTNAVAFLSTLLCMSPLIDQYQMNGINLTIITSYIIGISIGGAFLYRNILKLKIFDTKMSPDQ